MKKRATLDYLLTQLAKHVFFFRIFDERWWGKRFSEDVVFAGVVCLFLAAGLAVTRRNRGRISFCIIWLLFGSGIGLFMLSAAILAAS